MRLGSFWRVERQIFALQVKEILEDGNDQVVVVTLRQIGDGDGADAAGSDDDDRETAAVRGVFVGIQSGLFLPGTFRQFLL